MHARNRHQEYLDYWDLAARQPRLKPFVFKNKYGGTSIDYTNQLALRTLTSCLLQEFYGILNWRIPDGYLCPPVPQRVDYLHKMADLLGTGPAGPSGEAPAPPRGARVRGLDVGTGASSIYCLLGAREYGWSFVGSDIDGVALESARGIVKENDLGSQIELRHQPSSERVFTGLVRPGETFALSVCNPPFHESLEHAHRSAGAKWQRMGRSAQGQQLNYQGKENELWCEGGEVGFVTRMAEESAQEHLRGACIWFSAMLSRESSLEPVWARLGELGARRRSFDLRQGKMTRWVVAWTFLGRAEREQRLRTLAAAAEAEEGAETAGAEGAGEAGEGAGAPAPREARRPAAPPEGARVPKRRRAA